MLHECVFVVQERRDLVAEMAERRSMEAELIKASFPSGKDVCLQKFYFIDFQSLYEVPDREDIRYLPCEVGVVEYSLHSGHSRHLHKFVDPGEVVGGSGVWPSSPSESCDV